MNNIKYESKGSIMEGLNSSIIKSLYIPLPNINEQSSIINFIYRKTAEIDCIIANKQKLISLYEEEKQAVINRAVIRGLNVNCELKRISEEWIGEIPKHWEIKKVKLICKIQGRIGFKGYKTSDLVFDGNGAITLGATHITKFNKIDLSEPVYLSWDKYYESPEIMVKEGDIVFTQRGAYLGKVGLIDKDYGDVTINPSLILLKNIKIHAPYLAYYLTSNYIRKSVDVISNSTAIPMISQEQLANFYCLIPPIEEQVEISKFIEEKNIASDRLIEKVKNQIELLQEYRTTLISEVVTGKIKVPNTIEA
jgi:type I restriction enzyme S subunit